MTHVPRVSVLIPTYNYARYLSESIDSVLVQDFDDYEVLVADDCSRDESRELISQYMKRDGRIRGHFHEKNMGMVANWNWCLREARGVFIKYLFGDDKLANSRSLGTLVAMLEGSPTASLAVSARDILNSQSKIVDTWDHIGADGLHTGREVGRSCLVQMGNVIGEPSVVLFRRDWALRGFDERYRQLVDLELWLHLLQRGDLVYTREPLCQFRHHEGQQTEVNKRGNIHLQEMIPILRDYRESFLPGGARLTEIEWELALKKMHHICSQGNESLSYDYQESLIAPLVPLLDQRDLSTLSKAQRRLFLDFLVDLCSRRMEGLSEDYQRTLARSLIPLLGRRDFASGYSWIIFQCYRRFRRGGNSGTASLCQDELDTEFKKVLGRSLQAWYSIRYKFTRPFLDLRRGWRKWKALRPGSS